jgi:hypothetical protein
MSNFDALKTIANQLLTNYPESQAWNESSFRWIREQAPGTKHVIGRMMLAVLLNSNGLTATFLRGQIRVNGNGISVKVAMMWEKGTIKFQNIRDIDFDFAFCLALYPNKAYGWLIPKEEIWKQGKVNTANPGIKDQHEGADAWVHIDPEDPRAWLKPYGGTIDQAIAIAKKSL